MFRSESAVFETKSRVTLFKSTRSSFVSVWTCESKSYFSGLLINPEPFCSLSASVSVCVYSIRALVAALETILTESAVSVLSCRVDTDGL